MIILPDSFMRYEIKKSNFTRDDITKALRKAKKGIGVRLRVSGIKGARVQKLSITTASGHARLISIITTADGLVIPILLRSKKDKIGKNMTEKNPDFIVSFNKMYCSVFEDLENNRFAIIT